MKKIIKFRKSILMVLFISCLSCSQNDYEIINGNNTNVDAGNDPNFKIIACSDTGLTNFNRKVVVFGIDIYAAPKVEGVKLLYAANLMAQYLDNNEDGTVDNPLVIAKMLEKKAFLFMWKTEADIPTAPPKGREGQDLGNGETQPSFVPNGRKGTFDSGLEEVWHLITHVGYANAYPTIFGETAGTSLSNAMDIARGGKFTSIPNSYPAKAWYSYDDKTCKYDCQATEYMYWAMSSILGAQANRLNEIKNEWKLNTKLKVKTTDKAIYKILTDVKYKFPTILPDGTYKR